jgi:Helix-turn-helix domain
MKPQTRAMLAMLFGRDEQGLSALDALRLLGCYRAGARVYELRKAGFNIRTERRHGETAVYFLETR